jgi:hypothetical protein
MDNRSIDAKANVEAKVVVEKTDAARSLSGPEKEMVASIVAGTAEKGKISAEVAREVEDADPHIRAALIQAFASVGITTEYLAKKIQEGMEAVEVLRETQSAGREEVPDHNNRHKFVTTALKALGAERPLVTKESRKIVYRSRLRGEVRDVEVNDAGH